MKTYLQIFAALCTLNFFGQDPHFSQFTEQHPLINPALTGATARIRVFGAYKNQWRALGAPYRTMGLTTEIRSRGRLIRRGKFGVAGRKERGNFAVGLSFFNDNLGDGSLRTTFANLSLATLVPTGKHSFLSLGLQASYVQRNLDATTLLFPSQFNGTGYDPGVGSGESFIAVRYSYPDYAGGILWTYATDRKNYATHKYSKARIGFSTYHIMKPYLPYTQMSKDYLARKYVAHGDFLFSLGNSNTALAPAYVVQLQGPAREIMGGIMLKTFKRNETKYTGYVKRDGMGFGVYYRTGDALILTYLMEWEDKYAIGVSYDLNISPLMRASRMRGGLELALRYTAPENLRQRVKMPSY